MQQEKSDSIPKEFDENAISPDAPEDESGLKRLPIREDFYAMSFCGMIRPYQRYYGLTRQEANQNFYNCLFIFGLQMLLVALVGAEILSADFVLTFPTLPTLVTRFVCGILLHIQLEGEVRQALVMLKYYNDHHSAFAEPVPAVAIAVMQLAAALFTEVININLICAQDTIMDCIMNFIALGVIAEVDDYYAGSLSHFPLTDAVERAPPILRGSKENPYESRPPAQKVVRVFYKILRTLYAAYYYYFMPFTIVLLSFISYR